MLVAANEVNRYTTIRFNLMKAGFTDLLPIRAE